MKTAQAKKQPILNSGHMLLGCRFDIWLRLLIQNRFHITPARIPQALYISLLSLILFPFALLERLILALPVRRQQVKRPLFVLGHWRSGTTYLQNLLSRDKAMGWFEPAAATMFNNVTLLGWLVRPLMRGILPDARPMDNLEYTESLPMEEVFAIASVSTLAVDNLMSFPEYFRYYLDAAFVDELPEPLRREWRRKYDYILRKQTWRCQGRPLMLKSPDATCRGLELYRMYPDARFIHIYRDPYKVVRSTINMFVKIMDQMCLQKKPDPMFIEDMIVATSARIFRKVIADAEQIPEDQIIEVRYEDFEQDALGFLRRIYGHLGLPGFEKAEPAFRAYIDSQKDYQKNRFDIEPRLVRKINEQCGFYFEHYGYAMKEV
ncbi:MAG: sulfotransferase [Firmicutes bacterium]|nr:sulfotransferase [Bacillota bacterium]